MTGMIIADSSHLISSFFNFLGSLVVCLIALASSNARRRLIDALRNKQALSAQTAVALAPKGPFEPRSLEVLLRRGEVVSASDDGKYFLDETKHAEMRARDRKRALLAMTFLVLLAVALGYLI